MSLLLGSCVKQFHAGVLVEQKLTNASYSRIEVRTGDVSFLSIATILIAREFPCTFGDLMRQLQQFCSHADD